MSNVFNKIIIFAAGALVGSAVTYKILDKKLYEEYERRYQEEVESMKKMLTKKYENTQTVDSSEVEEEKSAGLTLEEFRSFENELNKLDYAIDFCNDDEQKGVPDMSDDEPYVIPPEEFGENDYEIISLTYYADGVLADDMDDIVDNVDDVVGVDSLTHFGEYEEDSVFVRNDLLQTDYEILRDPRKYSDVVGDSPHQVEE